MNKPSIILSTDNHLGLGILADQVSACLQPHATATIVPAAKLEGMTCDALVTFWWRELARGLAQRCRAGVVVAVIHDGYSWARDEAASNLLEKAIARVGALIVGSEAIFWGLMEWAAERGVAMPPCYIAECGVDTGAFKPLPLPQGRLTALWAGNSQAGGSDDDLKGLGMLKEACRRAGMPLLIADSSGVEGEIIPYSEMPAWYGQGHVVLIGSTGESFPYPLGEGLAAGRYVISTRVGQASRMIQHGLNGLIVDRTVEAFEAAIKHARDIFLADGEAVSHLCRASVLPYDLRYKMPIWRAALLMLVGSDATESHEVPAETRPPPRPASKRAAKRKPEPVPDLSPYDRLHLGCGPKYLRGWCNVDIAAPAADVKADSLTLRLPPAHFEEIYCCHMLEHVFPEETVPLLRRWLAALKPGGVLRLSVPDLRLVLANTVESHAFGKDPNAPLFGDYRRAAAGPDRHRQTFTVESLTRLLCSAGFSDVQRWRSDDVSQIHALADWSSYETISLNLVARKPGGTASAKRDSAPQPQPKPTARPRPRARANSVSDVEIPQPRVVTDEPSRHVLLSIISGTYNRLGSLMRFIESVRNSIPRDSISYEIVLADGGSTDGTRKWISEQPDCVLVEGGLTGAIDAFNAAYRVSRGEYVFQANDDTEVVGDGITQAILFLLENPAVGQVCFEYSMDGGRNWLAPVHAMTRPIVGGTNHPNVALTRRLCLEDVCSLIGDFWGDDAHRIDATYGGDTLQGCAVAHSLWRSVFLTGRCRIVDRHCEVRDELKIANINRYRGKHENGSIDLEFAKVAAVAQEWPDILNPNPGAMPRRSPIEAGPQERLLLVPMAHDGEPQIGLRSAFSAMGPTMEVLPLMGEMYRASPETRLTAIAQAIKAHQPTVIWIQHQGSGVYPRNFLQVMREAAPPHCLIATWNGDVRSYWYPECQDWMIQDAKVSDLALHSSTDYPRMFKRYEVARPGYLQVGYDTGVDDTVVAPDFDLPDLRSCAVFTGSTQRHNVRTPYIIETMEQCRNLHVFGHNWPESDQTHPFMPRANCGWLYNTAALSINLSITADLDGYSSDRLNRLGGAGACIALRRFKGMEHWGIRDGVHALCWDSVGDLVEIIRDWTRPERAEDRKVIRENVRALAQRWWSWEAVVEMFLALVRFERAWREDKRIPC